MDLGDPANCQHSDLEKDEREIRKMALRINHRRTALRQQDAWIRSATEGLARIESEISSTHETAKNLADQLDALEAQRADITAHIRRNAHLNELEAQSSGLMRLKDHRMKLEVGYQKRHNERALRNHRHNQVLAKLQQMRTTQGLALGKLDDPKPYSFVQQGLEDVQQAAAHVAEDTAAVEVQSNSDASLEAEAAQVEQLEQADLQEQAEEAAEAAAEKDDE